VLYELIFYTDTCITVALYISDFVGRLVSPVSLLFVRAPAHLGVPGKGP